MHGRARRFHGVLAPALAFGLTVVAAQATAAPDATPELLLSWNAPYGSAGAASGMTRECGDSTRTDTLYLSYRMPTDRPAFTGIVGTLLFQPQFDDSLASFWMIEGHNPPFMKVEFPSDTASAFRAGWKAAGVGGYRFYPNPTQGMLRLIFAVPATAAQPIDAGIYCFARVVIQRPLRGERCDQGLCVEFRDAKFSYSVNDLSVRAEQVRASYVTINSPLGLACVKYRQIAELRRAQLEAAIEQHRQAGTTDTSGSR